MKNKAEVKKALIQIWEDVKPYRWEYLFGGIMVFLILYSAMYDDFFATYRHGLNFWYALTEGHPLSFYSYAKAIPSDGKPRDKLWRSI